MKITDGIKLAIGWVIGMVLVFGGIMVVLIVLAVLVKGLS